MPKFSLYVRFGGRGLQRDRERRVEYKDWDGIKLGPGPLVLVFWDPVPSLKHRYSVLCVVAMAL